MLSGLHRVLRLKTWLYTAYLLVASAALLVLIELGLWGLDVLSGGKFSPLVDSDYPSRPGDYVKVAIYGESAAAGHGVERSFEDVLHYELPKCYPEQKFYIRNYARRGFTFHGHQAEIAKANIQRYDILLIYAGHNEHQVYLDSIGYFCKPGFTHVRSIRAMPGDDMSLVRRLLDYHSRIFATIARYKQQRLDAAIAQAGDSEDVPRLRPEFASEGVLPPAERQKIDVHFREDLEEIARLAERYGKHVIIMSVPSNESWKPMFSVLNPALSAEQRKGWQQDYSAGLSLYREGKFPQALDRFHEALAIDPGVAVANYYTGMTYRALGNAQQSKKYLRLAIDRDGLPIRALGSLFPIAKAVADKSPNVHYCDMNAIFEKLVDLGYGWDELFLDIQHPSFAGHVAIGLGFLGKIAELAPLGNPSNPIAHVDFDSVNLRSLVAFYQQRFKTSLLDEMIVAYDVIRWFWRVSDQSAYPEDFLSRAQENLVPCRTKYQESPDNERYYAYAASMVQAKVAWYLKTYFSMAGSLAEAGKTDEALERLRRALRLNPHCAETHSNLGMLLAKTGNIQEAVQHYEEALRASLDDASAHHNLASALAQVGKTGEAIEHFQQALRLKPDYAEAHNSLGIVLIRTGKSDDAIEHLQEVLHLKPDRVEVHNSLGVAWAQAGKADDAIQHFQQVLRVHPENADAHYNLGAVLARQGRVDEAVQSYERFLQLAPEHMEALSRLAWLLATRDPGKDGDAARAIQLAQRACELGGQDNAQCLDTLAVAYAAAGRFTDAVTAAERAAQLAESAGQTAVAEKIQSRLELYRAGRPYRESPH